MSKEIILIERQTINAYRWIRYVLRYFTSISLNISCNIWMLRISQNDISKYVSEHTQRFSLFNNQQIFAIWNMCFQISSSGPIEWKTSLRASSLSHPNSHTTPHGTAEIAAICWSFCDGWTRVFPENDK